MRIYTMSCGQLKAKKNIFLPQAGKDLLNEMPIPVFLIMHPDGSLVVVLPEARSASRHGR